MRHAPTTVTAAVLVCAGLNAVLGSTARADEGADAYRAAFAQRGPSVRRCSSPGLYVAADGDGALQSHPDPMTNKPLEYKGGRGRRRVRAPHGDAVRDEARGDRM